MPEKQRDGACPRLRKPSSVSGIPRKAVGVVPEVKRVTWPARWLRWFVPSQFLSERFK